MMYSPNRHSENNSREPWQGEIPEHDSTAVMSNIISFSCY